MQLSTEEQVAMYRKLAKQQFNSIDIEIDEYPEVSLPEEDDDGAWVAAWVHVDKPDEDDDEDPSP